MKKEKEKKSVKKSKTIKKTKTDKKVSSIGKWVNLGILLLGLILVVIGIFVGAVEIPFKVFGSLIMLGSFIAYAVRSKEHVLVKSIISTTLIAILLTWLLPYGAFSGNVYAEYGMGRIGLNDIPTVIYYAVYFALDKLMYLFVLGGFYGVLSLTKGYQKLVTSIAKKLESNKMTVVIVSMVIFALLTTLLTNSLAVLFFVPFVISIMSKMKVDKLSSFIATFGGILVGLMAAPWGTEGLTWFNYYVGTTITNGFKLRLIITAISLLLFIVFVVIRSKKLDKKVAEAALTEDTFEVASLEEKTKKAPIVILLAICAIVILLGYIDWKGTLGIEVFSKFHEWLVGLTIGENTTIFAYILGSSAKMLGSWDIATLVAFTLVMSIIVGLVYRIKLSDFLTAFGNGMQKMLKPVAIYVAVFTAFVVMYMTPIMPTIANWFYGLTEGFNLFTTSLMAFIASIFQTDLGYTGYALGAYLTSTFADKLDLVHTIHIAMYGMVQLILPTSGLLVLGLAYTKVEYKTWLKFIWKFAVAMLIILMIIFSIAAFA